MPRRSGRTNRVSRVRQGPRAGAGAGTAGEHQPTNAADDYVAMLLAKAEAAKPYSQAADYVDTLVYWHHHPLWGFES